MYSYIKDESNFYELALELSEGETSDVFCDLETTGLDPRVSKILLFQVMANDKIFIFDFLHLNKEHLKYLINLLKTTKVTSVFHNTKFDLKFIYNETGIWMDRVFDTMNCEVLINAGVGKSTYKLSELALKYCGIELEKETRDLFTANEVTIITDQMLNYSAMDVKVLSEIYYKQLELVDEAKEMEILRIEMDLLPVVAKMEFDGVLLDTQKWTELDSKERIRLEHLSKELLEIFIDGRDMNKYEDAFALAKALSFPMSNLSKKKENEMRILTGKDLMREWARQNFNIGSTYQVQAALGLQGINVVSTDKKVLNKLPKTPVINALLEKSECAKRISTYGIGVLDFINPVSGRIHTEFLDMGTATGRFSSGNPINLQNIPNAPGYRESFVASPDYDWISADYSQEEFRLTGAVSGERKIIDAYLQGADMHTATATLIYNKPLSEITKQERFVGKTANFTIIYGGTEYALGKNLSIPENKAKEILRAFNTGFPTLAAFKEAAETMIVKMGYSATPLGRRRYNTVKPVYMNADEYLRYVSKLKREGFNHIIQGGAADIIKIAMVNIYNKNPFGDKLKMMIQVHDEIDAEAHKTVSQDAAQFMKEEMEKAEQPFLKEIPAQVDVSMGDHWIH